MILYDVTTVTTVTRETPALDFCAKRAVAFFVAICNQDDLWCNHCNQVKYQAQIFVADVILLCNNL